MSNQSVTTKGRQPLFTIPATLARYSWLIPPVAVALVGILSLTLMGQYDQRKIALIAIYTLIVAGLNLSFGYGGELAFGQVFMFAAGAYSAALLMKAGVTDLLVAFAVAILIAGLAGLISGAPGLRLSGWALAMSSFFLVLLIPKVLNATEHFTGGFTGISGIQGLTLFGIKLNWTGLLIAAIVAAYLWLVVMRNIVLSRRGSSLKVLRESPLLAKSLGVPVYQLRMSVYILGGLPAGAAGVLYAYYSTFLSPEGFTLNLAITLLAAAVLGGLSSIYGAVIGVAILVYGPLQSAVFERYSLLIYGAFLIIVGVLLKGGIAGLIRRLARKFFKVAEADAKGSTDHAATQLEIHGERLTVDGIEKSFGGNKALRGATLSAEPGRITAILGANGAGKTTLLNSVSGFISIDAGKVSIGESDVTGLAAHQIAAIGVGRTFQTPLIPEEMTALEVVETGRLTSGKQNLLSAIFRTPGFRRTKKHDREVSLAALQFAGLMHLAHQDARALPLGTRRLLEVVRAVASEPKVMLLDEPAAGLDDSSLHELAELIRRARDAGATVVLVEHNVPFVLGLADDVHVMHMGETIASGTPDEVKDNPTVVATYLGRRPVEARATSATSSTTATKEVAE